MSSVAMLASRCPHHEHRNVVHHSHALNSHLAIGLPLVLPSEKIAVEEFLQVPEVDSMILQVLPAFPLIQVITEAVYMRQAYTSSACAEVETGVPRKPNTSAIRRRGHGGRDVVTLVTQRGLTRRAFVR